MRLLGHPVHPMLIVFPVGLLAATVIFDLVYLLTGAAEFATVAFWVLAGGLLGGALAAVFGLLDWMRIPRPTRARRVGAMHGAGNVVVMVLFALSFVLRLGDPAYLPSVAAVLLGLGGIGLALVTAWLGGELVYRHGVGVDADASLDATNSLQAKPEARSTAAHPSRPF